MLASFRTAHINKNVLIIIDADSTVSEEVSFAHDHVLVTAHWSFFLDLGPTLDFRACKLPATLYRQTVELYSLPWQIDL